MGRPLGRGGRVTNVKRQVSAPRRGRQSWRDAATLLWPGPEDTLTVRRMPAARAKAGTHSWWMLPSAGRPRFFVPVDSPGGWRVVARSGAGGRADQVQALASRLLRTGVGKVLPMDRLEAKDRGIEQHLEQVLGRQVRVGVRLGRVRADRVLVLQVLAADGATLAFAKLGSTEISDAGLAVEAGHLRRVVDLAPTGVSAPTLLHEGNWAGRHLLVMSAVDGQPMPAADELPAVPMRRLAEAAGTVKSTLAESDFMTRMRSDIEQVREKEVRDALADHLDVIAAHFGDATLWFGAWHGDWVPWNMARHGDEVLLWDWEHYEEGVPVGFDALHFRGQQLRNADRKHLDRGEENWWAERRSLLGRLDVPAEAADLTAVLYLLRVNVRFVIEGQSDQDVSPRRVGWALPLLARTVDDLVSTAGRADV